MVEHSMVPIPYGNWLWYLWKSFVDHLNNMSQRLLACGQPIRIELAKLQSCEDRFRRCRWVRVGTRVHNWQVHCGQSSFHDLTRVPSSVVEENNCCILPLRILSVQLSYHTAKEESHDVGIRVGLGQSKVHLAIGVESQNQGDSWMHLLVPKCTGWLRRHPCSTKKSGLIEPWLVHVDHSLTLLQ